MPVLTLTRRGLLLVKAAIGALLLGLIAWTIEPSRILSALRGAERSSLAVAALLMPVNLALQEWKWRYLVRLVEPSVPLRQTWGSLLGGMAFGIVTPGRIGEYGRSLLIPGTPPLKLVGLTVIDKFYNLGLTIAVGLPALFSLPWAVGFLGEGYFHRATFVALGVFDLVLLYMALDPRPVRSLLYAAQLLLPKGDKIAQLAGGLDRFTPAQARVTFLFTLAHYGVFLLQYHILINGMAALPWAHSSRGAASTLFAKSALPVAIGDLGVDQIVAVQFFGQFGVAAEAAFNASLLLFALNVLMPALTGVFFVGRLPVGRGKAVEQ
ncbi:MAG: flippase-like domain-containing protein [Calditrichaeota bacterium]|nr:flippase-like domain-containing protein [Calditrichota bacterium]